jgi:hypothetical protein
MYRSLQDREIFADFLYVKCYCWCYVGVGFHF